MNPSVAALTLIAFAVLWLTLPLLPALIELRRKTDADPLAIIQDHAGDIRYFANTFRTAVDPCLERLSQCGTTEKAALGNGATCVLVGKNPGSLFIAEEAARNYTERIFLFAQPVSLPPHMVFENEIYGADGVEGGEANTYKAILADKSVRLGPKSQILRWVHAEGVLEVGSDSALYGRASSAKLIHFDSGCQFQRVEAPRIEFGPAPSSATTVAAFREGLSTIDTPLQRRLIPGDFELRPGDLLKVNVVASGEVRIRRGARILGSLKSGKGMHIAEAVTIDGSIVSSENLHLGPNCRIRGPVVAEGAISIDRGCIMGSPNLPTTVSAPRISISAGTLIYGTVWPREQGRFGIDD